MKFDVRRFRPSFYREIVDDTGPRRCRKCPTILGAWLKHYCSFRCKELAIIDKSYGHEDEVI